MVDLDQSWHDNILLDRLLAQDRSPGEGMAGAAEAMLEPAEEVRVVRVRHLVVADDVRPGERELMPLSDPPMTRSVPA